MSATSSSLQLIQQAWDTVVPNEHVTLRGDEGIVDDLAVDSLQATELVVCLERSLSLSILGDARLDDVKTVADLCQLLDQLRAEESA